MERLRVNRAALVVAALAALLLLIVAPGAGAAGPQQLEYSGKLNFESSTGSVFPPPRNFGKFKVTLQWVATANTEDSGPWDFKELSGTVHWDQKGSPPDAEGHSTEEPPCDATLSERPGGADNVYVTPHEGNVTRLEISTQLPLIGELLKSTQEGSGGCSVLSVVNGFTYAGTNEVAEEEKSEAGLKAFELALRPNLIAKTGASTTTPFDFVFNREIPTGAGDPTVLEVHSQIHVGPGGTGGGGETSPGKKGGRAKAGSSGGSAACKVPKLLGKKLKAAKGALEGANCKLGKVTFTKGATAKTGKVVKQKTKAGTVLKAGAKVAVKLG